MDVKDAIAARRAYRSFAPTEITPALIDDLATNAQLAPSCFNNQPWRFVFIYQEEMRARMREAFSRGNEWCYDAPLIIAVVSRKDSDCVIKDREYYQFDTGMATAFLILRATELGLVAHPIAGFSPAKVREVLGVPEDTAVITLVQVGTHAATPSPVLSEKQLHDETGGRPERKPLSDFAFHNHYPAG